MNNLNFNNSSLVLLNNIAVVYDDKGNECINHLYNERESLAETVELIRKFIEGPISHLSTEGFVKKDPDILAVRYLLDYLNIPQSVSIPGRLNTEVFQMILLLILSLLDDVKGKISLSEGSEISNDLFYDADSLTKDVFRRLHPEIQSKLANKGIKVFLNTFVGYDSEYETISSAHNQNEMLSAQLAVNTNMYIRIPQAEYRSLEAKDF